MKNMNHKINDIVFVEPFEGFAAITGVTNELRLVVHWYNDEGEEFTAIVEPSECIGKDEINGISE